MLTTMTKFTVFCVLLLGAVTLAANHNQIIEIDLSGLSCSFCVYGLDKNLEKHTEIDKAEISLKQNKARIYLVPDAKVTIDEIKEIIKDAGFASGNYQHYGRAEHPCETADC